MCWASRDWKGAFPHRVGLHQSCHGLRELRLASSSELVGQPFNKARSLLEGLTGISFADLTRPDECCGFGGTFAVAEEAVSCMMGRDRIHDHEQAGTEVLTADDMSCLMHLEGLIRRDRKPMRVMHIAEILVEATRSVPQPTEIGDKGMLGTWGRKRRRGAKRTSARRQPSEVGRANGSCGLNRMTTTSDHPREGRARLSPMTLAHIGTTRRCGSCA